MFPVVPTHDDLSSSCAWGEGQLVHAEIVDDESRGGRGCAIVVPRALLESMPTPTICGQR